MATTYTGAIGSGTGGEKVDVNYTWINVRPDG
jgi:hypothetical protein